MLLLGSGRSPERSTPHGSGSNLPLRRGGIGVDSRWRSGCRPNVSVAAPFRLPVPHWLGRGSCFQTHRVGRGSHPPPPPPDRSVRISCTTLFGRTAVNGDGCASARPVGPLRRIKIRAGTVILGTAIVLSPAL